jgi:hypothetical protein
MSATLVSAYTGFSLLLFYQQLHIKNFCGASQGFLALLNIFAFVSLLFGIAFLLYFGYVVSWLLALALFAIALVVKFAWFAVEAKLGLRGAAPVLSLLGFIGIPVCGYFMWSSIPQS